MRLLRMKIFKAQICLSLLLILVVGLWGEKLSSTTQPTSLPVESPQIQHSSSKADINGKPSTGDTKKLSGNPFQYRVSTNNDGFLPTATQTMPSGIQVMAIILVKGKKPLAAIHVPGMSELIYFREGDIVSIETDAAPIQRSISGMPVRKHDSRNSKTNQKEIIYLKIDSISAQQVILHPEKNPAGKRVLQ